MNGLGGRGISTHAALTLAVAERLQQAGVRAGNILVWDRNARDLGACGMTVNTDASRVRCYGSDVGGYEDEPSWGTARIRLAKILTRECAMMINLPILKDHELAGVTFSMKNMYGVVDKPFVLHANDCNPGVADVNAFRRCARRCGSRSATRFRRCTTAGRGSILSGYGTRTR